MIPPRLTARLERSSSSTARCCPHRDRPMACPARCWSRSGGWRPTSASTTATSRRCARWRRWPMTAGAPTSFADELLDALRIIDRGDLTPADMRGAWAGEIGQTQFMPSSYIKYAVDFDGNGKRDLLHSAARCAGFDRQLSRRQGLATRPAVGSPGTPNFDACCRSGTRARSTPRPSLISPASSRRRRSCALTMSRRAM